MKNLRKGLTLALAVILILGLVTGCGGGSKAGEN